MNILLVGFFGEGNLGDEAILQGIVTTLPAGVRLTVTAGSTPLAGECRRIPRRGFVAFPKFVQALRDADYILFSGGMLQDWSFDGVIFYALRMLASRFTGLKPGIWGGGLGPLRRASAKKLAARALKTVSVCWARDQQSQQTFAELTGRPAFLGADWSWALSPDQTASIGSHPKNITLGVNLRPWFSSHLADGAVKEIAARSVLHQCVTIAARVEDQRLMRLRLPDCSSPDIASFSRLVQFCSTLQEGWAMRYHVLLAMLRAGIPVVGLPYDEKVRSLCREAGIHVNREDALQFTPQRARIEFFHELPRRFSLMRQAFLSALETTQRRV